MTCDKCKAEPVADVVCRRCGNHYYRCQQHGGVKGAMRSLSAHCGVFHPGDLGAKEQT